MQFIVSIKSHDSDAETTTLVTFERNDLTGAASLGLTIDESKALLRQVQRQLFQAQHIVLRPD